MFAACDDLYYPDDAHADHVIEEFDIKWKAMLKSGKTHKRPLLTVLRSMYGSTYFFGGLFKLLWSVFIISGAFYFGVLSPTLPLPKLPGACWFPHVQHDLF